MGISSLTAPQSSSHSAKVSRIRPAKTEPLPVFLRPMCRPEESEPHQGREFLCEMIRPMEGGSGNPLGNSTGRQVGVLPDCPRDVGRPYSSDMMGVGSPHLTPDPLWGKEDSRVQGG